MAKTLRVKRNIKKNISRYNTNKIDKLDVTSSFFTKIAIILFAVMLPLIAYFAAANVVFRVPDIYSFDLNRTEVLNKELMLETTPAKIGNLLSDYMLHKTDRFRMTANFKGSKSNVFTITDTIMIARSRAMLDKMFVAMGAMLVFSGLILGLMVKADKWKAIRRGVKAGFAFYGLGIFGFLLFIYSQTMRTNFFAKFMKVGFTDFDTLPQMFGGFYRLEAIAVLILLATILMFIWRSIVWNLTKGEKMFV
jgi:hypothetical protein